MKAVQSSSKTHLTQRGKDITGIDEEIDRSKIEITR